MTTDDKTAKPRPPSREEKLAQALRANLRRRKGSGPAGTQKSGPAKSGEAD